MKRDDFGMRIDEIRELATKYSKNDLARMVQMGMIEPQKALMAGMMIERIAKSALEEPKTTVIEDVLAPAPTTAQGQIPEGIMGAPGAPAPSSGVAALPSGIREMAGGGIVAFADGGDTDDIPGYADRGLVSDTYYDPRRYIPDAPTTAPAAPAAPAPATSGLPTLPGGFKLREYPSMERPTLKGELEQLREAERLTGVDTAGLIQQMREEEKARRDELKGRKEEAQGEAIMMAGLGLMGARRGQEFQTLAGVSRQALAQYSGALREIRDTEKDIKKTERELALAEDKLKRDQSGKALESYKAKSTRLEDLDIQRTNQYNKAVEKASDLFVEQYKTDEAAKRALEVAKMNGDYQLAVARIHAASANKLGETERLLARYHDKLAKEGPQAAAAFMGDIERVRGAGKPQNIMSFEEAMRIIGNDIKYSSKSLEEKIGLANQLVQSQSGLSSGAPPSGQPSAAGTNRPSLSSFDKR